MNNLKFKGHGSFFLRRGWVGKGLRAVVEPFCDPASEPDPSRTFATENIVYAMDKLGIGKNMVSSLRYWMNTMGLIREEGRGKKMHAYHTELGKLVFENDPYVEELGTLFALHCKIIEKKTEATSWYWFFNEKHDAPFSKNELAAGIQKYATLNGGSKINTAKVRGSIESDVDCILSTYIPYNRRTGKKASPENLIDCPLGELRLIDFYSKGVYKKCQPAIKLLPNELFLFSLLNAYENEGGLKLSSNPEFPFEKLLNGANYPGRAFNLSESSFVEKLYDLQNACYVRVNCTAGTNVVRLTDPSLGSMDYLRKYYEELG